MYDVTVMSCSFAVSQLRPVAEIDEDHIRQVKWLVFWQLFWSLNLVCLSARKLVAISKFNVNLMLTELRCSGFKTSIACISLPHIATGNSEEYFIWDIKSPNFP